MGTVYLRIRNKRAESRLNREELLQKIAQEVSKHTGRNAAEIADSLYPKLKAQLKDTGITTGWEHIRVLAAAELKAVGKQASRGGQNRSFGSDVEKVIAQACERAIGMQKSVIVVPDLINEIRRKTGRKVSQWTVRRRVKDHSVAHNKKITLLGIPKERGISQTEFREALTKVIAKKEPKPKKGRARWVHHRFL